ncbi:MAG: proton-conducting transporter membrane subunit [Candidatus Omnitrophica bacterium]|nr:proton-conducting transporter membrane subunit [Candidatus Omnitrophota bacterium]
MTSLLILIPLFSVMVLNLPSRTMMRRFAFWLSLILAASQVCLAAFFGTDLWNNANISGSFFQFNLAVDNLSRVMLFSIGIVVLAAILAGRELIKDENRQFNFTNLMLLILAGMNGVVTTVDVFSLYVFMEITAVASFVLISLQKDRDALEASFKYIIFSALASVMMLAAIALLLMVSGETGFPGISHALSNLPTSRLTLLAVSIFICGLFIKGGAMPFHGWLPDAYSAAPAPVSILLAGIVTKTLGIYTLIRIVGFVLSPNYALNNILLLVGTISIVAGALAALGQKDLKRMLSYSSISQVGYIIIGLGCGTPLGIFGAIFHLFNHSIFKSLLFTNSAAVESRTNTRNMEELGGLAERMPCTGTTSIIGFLSAAGIPPLSGFWSKIIIVVALWQAGFHAYSAIAVMAGAITLAYFLSMQRRVFFGKIKEELKSTKEANFNLLLPALLLAAITVGAGILFPFVHDTFITSFFK